jgi:hypothetical protein
MTQDTMTQDTMTQDTSLPTPNASMPFCEALRALQRGFKVRRANTLWQSKHRFVYLVPGSQFTVSRAPLDAVYPLGFKIDYQPHLDVAYTDSTCGVWTLTQEDVLARDWMTFES